jgi:hypothetical protein
MAISTRCLPSRFGTKTEWTSHAVAFVTRCWFIGMPSWAESMTDRTGGRLLLAPTWNDASLR